jgi:hypothetical protein
MSLIDTIKADSLKARKEKSPTSAVLLTVLGTIETRAKQKGSLTGDEMTFSVVKSTLKGLDDTIAILENKDRDADLVKAKAERDALLVYIPKGLSDEELQRAIDTGKSEGATNVGALMGYLKANHTGLYDGKKASKMVQESLK